MKNFKTSDINVTGNIRLDQVSGDSGIYLYRSTSSDLQLALGSASSIIKSVGDISLMPSGTTVNKYTFKADTFAINGPNVGFGASNPARLLHLKNSNSAIAFETPIDANGSAFAQIKSGRDGSSGYSSTLEFATTESTTAVPTFGGNGTGGSGFVTRMLIDSTGNVGIGTITPSAPLEVSSSVAEKNSAVFSNTHVDGYGAKFVGGGGNDEHHYLASFRDYTGNEKFRLQGNGNVGIDTNTPIHALELYGKGKRLALTSDHPDGTRINHVELSSDGSGYGYMMVYNDVGNPQARVHSSGSSYFNGGSVGIGTNAPESLLHIFANASSVNPSTLLTLENYSSDLDQNSTYINFKFTDTNDNEDPQVQIGALVGQNAGAGSALAEGAGAFIVKTNYPTTDGDPTSGIQYNDATNLAERLRVDYRGVTSIKRYDKINTSVASERTQLRPVLELTTSNNDTTGGSSVVYTGHGGSIDFYTPTYHNNIPSPTARIAAQIDSNSASTWGGRLSFWTTLYHDSEYEERARLDHAGRWNIWSSSSVAQIIHTDKPNSGNNYFLRGYANASLHDSTNATTGFEIYTNGDMRNANGVYGTLTSDARLKENVVDATGKLQDLLSLNVKNFNLIGHKQKQIGFIAQEFEQVFPDLVTKTDTREYDNDGDVVSGIEDSRSLKVGMEFAILVKAIQEQQQIIDKQQQVIDQISERINNLRL